MRLKNCNLLLLTALFLFSCNQHDERTEPTLSQTPVRFQSTITGAGYSTRASGTTWGNDSIGVYMIKDGETLSNTSALADNRLYETKGNGTFISSVLKDMIYFPEDGSAVNFIGYYPYTTDFTADHTLAIDVSDQSSQEAIDLMYSGQTGPYTKTNPTIPLSFNHQLVKLVLNLSPSTTDETLDGVTATISGMKTKATFNLTNGDLTVEGSSAGEIVMKTTSYTTGKALAEAILLPESDLTNVKIVFTLPSGKTTTWQLKDEGPFLAKNRYSYDVILKGDGVTTTPSNGWFETPVITSMENTIYVQHFLPETEKSHLRNYSLLYDTKECLAYWVAYPLHSSYVGNVSRTNYWRYDPVIAQEFQPDLSNSYPAGDEDRGHQLPSADRTYSTLGNRTTFYFSNMTAQNNRLNQGIWANLEKKVRETWMPACDTLYVVTGAMITANGDQQVTYTMDKNGKAIAKPKYYYKALAQKRGDQYYTIAFKMNNEAIPSSTNFTPYQLSVSELEAETGFTFFPALSKSVKDQISSIW